MYMHTLFVHINGYLSFLSVNVTKACTGCTKFFLKRQLLEYSTKKISSLLSDIFIITFFFIKIIIRLLSILSFEYFDTVSWTTFETSCKYIFYPQRVNFRCRITFQFFNDLFESIFFFFFLQYLFLLYKMSAYFIIFILYTIKLNN